MSIFAFLHCFLQRKVVMQLRNRRLSNIIFAGHLYLNGVLTAGEVKCYNVKEERNVGASAAAETEKRESDFFYIETGRQKGKLTAQRQHL